MGANAIAFAQHCKVEAFEIDKCRMKMAEHNANIYGISDSIDFHVQDFLQAEDVVGEADVVFLSPPWGGPEYINSEFDIFNQFTPSIVEIARV